MLKHGIPYFFYVWRDKMADKQQLVYEINIIANGTDKIEGVKKSLET